MSVQSPPSTHSAKGHIGSMAQEPTPSQSVSQRHESEQSMPPAQDADPLHSTSQRPAPQVIGPPHDPLSLHVISQRLASLQSTPEPQAVVPAQCTSHAIPAGQITRSGQAPVPSHRMMQVSR